MKKSYMKQSGELVSIKISSKSQYIISTSGRISSMKRYQRLLQEILGLDICYLPITANDGNGQIRPEHFAQTIRGLGAIGGAISKDIKGKIIPFLDELDPFAEQVQSVNTVIRRGEKLIGYNLDALGFEVAIKKGIEQSGVSIKTALVYGYGGVFNVVYHVLTKLGIEVHVTGRRPEGVTAINKQYGLKPFDGTPKDLFVNATPVTDSPLEDAVGFISGIEGSKLAFDHEMPGENMADYCRENSISYIPGTEMYYPQMYKQWALFLEGLVPEHDLPRLIEQAST